MHQNANYGFDVKDIRQSMNGGPPLVHEEHFRHSEMPDAPIAREEYYIRDSIPNPINIQQQYTVDPMVRQDYYVTRPAPDIPVIREEYYMAAPREIPVVYGQPVVEPVAEVVEMRIPRYSNVKVIQNAPIPSYAVMSASYQTYQTPPQYARSLNMNAQPSFMPNSGMIGQPYMTNGGITGQPYMGYGGNLQSDMGTMPLQRPYLDNSLRGSYYNANIMRSTIPSLGLACGYLIIDLLIMCFNFRMLSEIQFHSITGYLLYIPLIITVYWTVSCMLVLIGALPRTMSNVLLQYANYRWLVIVGLVLAAVYWIVWTIMLWWAYTPCFNQYCYTAQPTEWMIAAIVIFSAEAGWFWWSQPLLDGQLRGLLSMSYTSGIPYDMQAGYRRPSSVIGY